MNNTPKRIQLAKNDVIHTESRVRSLELSQTFRKEALLEFIRDNWIRYEGEDDLVETGLDCEVLQANGFGWQKGKIKLSLEFIPDESVLFQNQHSGSLEELISDHSSQSDNIVNSSKRVEYLRDEVC